MTDDDVIRRDMPACLRTFAELAAKVPEGPVRERLRELYRCARDLKYHERRLVALSIASYVLCANGVPCAMRVYRVRNEENQRPRMEIVTC